MILTKLAHWKLTGTWPYVPLLGDSAETGAPLRGVTPTIDAEVPGSEYMDLLRAGLIEDPYADMNSIKCEWAANRWWIFDTRAHIPLSEKGRRIKIVFNGIDYRAHIYAGNKKFAEHEGMYVPCAVDITDVAAYGAGRVAYEKLARLLVNANINMVPDFRS